MRKLLLAALVLLTSLTACHEEAKFMVCGTIIGATDSTLYLEAITINNGVVAIDSTCLGQEGAFMFEHADTASCPEFYRLRIADQVINLAVDSTETVTVKAKWPRMAAEYTVEGSGQCDTIRLITQQLAQVQQELDRVANDRSLTMEEREEKIKKMVEEYKDDIKVKYIQNAYEKPASYFALMQMVNGIMIFDLRENESDVRWATAVANAWATYYPHSLRAKNLESVVLQGLRNTRKRTVTIDVDDERVRQTGIIDMGFPDINGRERRLSELKGKVVLLEFTAYAAKGAADRNIYLHELYAKYKPQGLEIYQVSIDPDIHYWKTVSENLPWVTVYNEEGEQSDMLQIYQVAQLPTYFLIDRNNDLHARMEDIPDLEKAIQTLLAK